MYEDFDDDAGERPRSRLLPGFLLGFGAAVLLAVGTGAAWLSHEHGPGWMRGRHDWRFAAEWVLRYVDATDDQERRIAAILAAAAPELEALRERHHARHEAWGTALAAEVVDRDVLEGLRASEIERADAASQRLVATLAEVADVLTPEQRAELLRAVERWHRR
jgi:Spy/CpxP family protein refolding chaperone